MKKVVLFTVTLLLISCLLCGCFSDVMFIPDNEYLGNSKNFEIEGFTISLTEKFHEEQSQRGFDAYYVSDFCGVVVLKEEFTAEEGLAEKSLETYTSNVIKNNGHTDISPQNINELWFYETTTNDTYRISYCYKGADAFWIVQFICNLSDKQILKDTFYLMAESVEIK